MMIIEYFNERFEMYQIVFPHSEDIIQVSSIKHGTAMGKKFAPAYANIYMADWELTALDKCPLPSHESVSSVYY